MSEHNEKVRIIQELVPGKQISIAHIIANPDKILYKKLGLDPAVDYNKSAIGIVTISPAETAIIIADVAIKNSGAEIGFVDRLTGTVSQVQEALESLCNYCKNVLGFTVCEVTKT